MEKENSTSLIISKNSVIAKVRNVLKVTEKILSKRNHLFIPFLKKNGFYILVNATTLEPILDGRQFEKIDPASYDYSEVGDFEYYDCNIEPNDGEISVDTNGKYVWSPEDNNDESKWAIRNCFSNTLKLIRKQGKWVLVKDEKDEIKVLKYDSVSNFSEFLALVSLNNKWGFIDKTGVEVIPLIYDDVIIISNCVAQVNKKHRWALVNKHGIEITPYYDHMNDFGNGLIRVGIVNDEKKNQFLNRKDFLNKQNIYSEKTKFWCCLLGFIDETGSEVVPLKFDVAWATDDFISVTNKDKKTGLFNRKGKEAIPIIWDNIWIDNKTGLFIVRLNSVMGVIDKDGIEKIHFKYQSLHGSFEEGLLGAKQNNKWGFIDESGREQIYFNFDYVKPFSEGLACVKLNGKVGFINKNGTEIIPFKYDSSRFNSLHPSGNGDMQSFVDGIASVVLNGKWGFVDKTGVEVITLKYFDVTRFNNGFARVTLKQGGKGFYINKLGQEYREL